VTMAWVVHWVVVVAALVEVMGLMVMVI